jgi:hypothetical protein
MKKAPAIGALLVVLTTSALYAAEVTVATTGTGGNYSGYGPYQTGVGGEFTLYSPDLAGYIANYTPMAQDQWNVAGDTPNFQTFCVEGDEYIDAYTTYDVTFNDVTVYTGDPLSKGAAYLYSQFASGGNFGGNATYNYGANRSTTAAELQDAIWAFMGGQEGQGMDLSNPFEAAAAIAIGGSDTTAGWDAATAASGGGYDGVYILNLWAVGEVDTPGGAGQDQLIWEGPPPGQNAPDGGATLTLLGMGLSGLAFYRRRR